MPIEWKTAWLPFLEAKVKKKNKPKYHNKFYVYWLVQGYETKNCYYEIRFPKQQPISAKKHKSTCSSVEIQLNLHAWVTPSSKHAGT